MVARNGALSRLEEIARTFAEETAIADDERRGDRRIE
jgi:hypothetical protein